MNDSTGIDFTCEVSRLNWESHSFAPPKRSEKWILSTKDDELYLVNPSTQARITINRRETKYRIQFPVLSRWADMIVHDARGDEWQFDLKLRDVDRLERWWSWYSQPRTTDSSPSENKVSSEQRTGLAVASLVCAIIAAWLSIFSIPAIICGHMAISNIGRDPNIYRGKGMATTGLILGYFALLLALAVGFMRGALKMQLINMGNF